MDNSRQNVIILILSKNPTKEQFSLLGSDGGLQYLLKWIILLNFAAPSRVAFLLGSQNRKFILR